MENSTNPGFAVGPEWEKAFIRIGKEIIEMPLENGYQLPS